MLLNPYVLLPFGKVHNPSRLSRESASERPKMARTYPVFNFFTSKCASCHNGVHFFDVSTSKVASTQRCLVHFDFQTRFWPQRHTLLRHLNFQKWSDVEEFCYILTSKYVSRHNGVHFFIIFHLSFGNVGRHYFPTLRNYKAVERRSVSRLSYFFAHLHFFLPTPSVPFFSLLIFLFSLPLPCLLFICPYCRRFDF